MISGEARCELSPCARTVVPSKRCTPQVLTTTALEQADLAGRVYADNNLALVPDINTTGPSFYTFWYRAEVDLQASEMIRGLDADSAADVSKTFITAELQDDMCKSVYRSFDLGGPSGGLWLELSGANYRVEAYANGQRLQHLPVPMLEPSIGEGEDIPGMFLRRRFPIALAAGETKVGREQLGCASTSWTLRLTCT